jgi:CHAT domain-containing protein/Tfp pilus assembly protein PilF
MDYRQAICSALLLACFSLSGSARAQLTPGVVVEEVTKNFAGDKAGLKEGDLLLAWSRGESKGKVESPFDFSWIELEQEPRGTVILEGLRGSEKKAWTMGPDTWGVKVRPQLEASVLSVYGEAQDLAASGKVIDSTERWRRLAKLNGSSSPLLSAWFLIRAGGFLADAQQWKQADSAFGDALDERQNVGPAIATQVLRAWAGTFEQRSDWKNAEKYYLQAIAAGQELSEENLIISLNLDSLGDVASRQGELGRADDYYHRALSIQQKLAPKSLDVALSTSNLGIVEWQRGELAKAEEYLLQALDIREKLAPESLSVASSLNGLGTVAWSRGDLNKAEEQYRRALDLRQKVAPESLDVAASLNNLGMIANDQGDMAKAEEYQLHALNIRRRLAPASLDLAASFGNLGALAIDLGELAKAEEYYGQTLALMQKLVPDSLYVATSFIGLANTTRQRGDLSKAEEYGRQALALRQKLAPGSLYVADSFNALGIIAWQRGDLAKAEEYERAALAIREKLAPESLDLARSFINLGEFAQKRGDLVKAQEYDRGALSLVQKLAPESFYLIAALTNMGKVSQAAGDLVAAEKYHHQALALAQKLSPGSLYVAESLANLGEIARARRDLVEAEKKYRQALEIREKLVPNSAEHAESLASLAGILDRKGEAAAQLYEHALNALEKQMAVFGGMEETRANFRANHAEYYKHYVDLLVVQGKSDQALQVLERSRARTLLEMLNEAHVDIRHGVDSALVDRERSLAADIRAKSNRRIGLLNGQHTGEQLAAINVEIESLLAQHKDVEEQIRAASPAYAALKQPQPLTTAELQQLLDSNTTLLEYSLGEDRSYVFAVTSNSLGSHELPKRAEIEAIAQQLYRALATRAEDERTSNHIESLDKIQADKLATTLSQMILGPVASELQGKRLVIVSDGALQYIPFAALPAPRKPDMGKTADANHAIPLVVDREIVSLPSASVLAVLRRETLGRKEAPKAVAVLADPVFDSRDERVMARVRDKKPSKQPPFQGLDEPASNSQEHLSRSAADLGLQVEGVPYLPRLPFSRREAIAILKVTPAGEGMKALDFAASRETARSAVLAQYRIVHFATHGLLDSQHPELSGLVLSMVGKQGDAKNGFLDLQDIYNLNLPAELVVLSACQTALGKEVNGEGILGMTRGFMYAGARRVVASLWNIDDVASAQFMAKFYRAMEVEKLSAAAALRQAQLEMRAQKRWAEPYYWAGFQLQGEWK